MIASGSWVRPVGTGLAPTRLGRVQRVEGNHLLCLWYLEWPGGLGTACAIARVAARDARRVTPPDGRRSAGA
jgi:hypothetical protein